MIRVRVREDLVVGEWYEGTFFNPDMEKYRGLEAQIIGDDLSGGFYLDLPDGRLWQWNLTMVEILELPKGYYGFNFENAFPFPIKLEEGEISLQGLRVDKIVPGKPLKIKLRRELYGVGKIGDIIDGIQIGGSVYLSSKYLPICGELSYKEYELT